LKTFLFQLQNKLFKILYTKSTYELNFLTSENQVIISLVYLCREKVCI